MLRLVLRASSWCAPVLLLLAATAPPAAAEAATPLKPEEIEQLVAPIALYPDSLLAQALMASTYPLEVVEAARWAADAKNAKLKGDALDAALKEQTWDASVKSLVAFPQVLTMMNEKLDWTQKLGDAVLEQQADVMDAVQRLRAKAQAAGNLESTKEQTVKVEPAPPPPAGTAPSTTTTIIQIQPTNPQVVYVPTYNPTVVYGAWPYPTYPPYSYYPPGYVAATSMLSFGLGMAVGASLWGGCNWGWGHGDIDVDVNRYNNFNNNVTKNFNQSNVQNSFNKNGQWQHDASHRKGVNYRDTATREKYGRGPSKDAAAREQFRGRVGSDGSGIAKGSGGRGGDVANRGTGGIGDRPGAGGGGVKDRPSAGGGGNLKDRGGQAHAPGSRDRAQAASKQRAPGAFEGVNHGAKTRADSSRGHASKSSMASSRGGGGGARAGGGGGGQRGGGGGGGRRR